MNNSQLESSMDLLKGYEDLGVSPLENNGWAAKRCRYLNPGSVVRQLF